MRIAIIAAFLAGANAYAQGETSRPNSAAPSEVRQYAFMIGDWVGRRINSTPLGEKPAGAIAWHGTYILDGWAVRTDWESHGADGVDQRGTMLRTFDPSQRIWFIAETYSLHPRLDVFNGRAEGDSVIQWSNHETTSGRVLARRVYWHIQPNAFEDRVEVSRDSGRTWMPQFREVFARARCPTVSCAHR